MKYIKGLLCILFFMPTVASAKENYKVEEIDLKQYVCDEINLDKYEPYYFDTNKIVLDGLNDRYIIDLEQPGICNKLENDLREYPSIYFEENKVYEAYYDDNKINIWALEKEIDEQRPFMQAIGEYDSTQKYHEINQDREATSVSEIDSNENDFKAGKYYLIVEPKSKELIATFTTDLFEMPKEKTGLDNDIKLDKSDLLYYINFANQLYFVFIDFDTQYRAIFNEDGEYQTFGRDTLLISDVQGSISGNYVNLLIENNGKEEIIILDSNYDEVLAKDVDNLIIFNFVGFKDNEDYLLYINKTNEKKIIKISRNIEYKINNNLKNISIENFIEKIDNGIDFTTILKADENYKLPEQIYILINGNELDFDKYEYNKETGQLKITAKYINGNITLVGEADKNTINNISSVPETNDNIIKYVILGFISIGVIGIICNKMKKRYI